MSPKKTACLATLLLSFPLAVPAESHAATVNWDENKVEGTAEKLVSSGAKDNLRVQELPSEEYKVYQNVKIGHAFYTGKSGCKLEANYNKGIFGDGFVLTISMMGGFTEAQKRNATLSTESIGNQLILQKGSRIGGILNESGEQIGTATEIYGGYAVPFADVSEAWASDNKVFFEGGSTVASYKSTAVHGGRVSVSVQATKAQAYASNNEVCFEKDAVIESTGYIDIYGGSVSIDKATQAVAETRKNTVTLKNGSVVKNSGYIKIYGGAVSLAKATQASAAAMNNTVTIEDGVSYEYGDKKEKTVTFIAGLADAPKATVTGEAYKAAEASDNTLSITNQADTEASWYVSHYGSSSNNYAGISAGMAYSGGKTKAVVSNNNTFLKFGSKLTLDLNWGGRIASGWAYSVSGEAEAISNTLEREGGILKDNTMAAGYARGGSSIKANSNTIKLTGVGQDNIDSDMHVAAGYAEGSSKSSSILEVRKNTAVITNNTRFAVYGGLADWGSDAVAEENTLEITGGESGKVYAGYAVRTKNTSSVTKNTLTVHNSTMDWGFAGYASSDNTANASDNKNMDVQDTTVQMALYGGYAEGTKATAKGNTGRLVNASFTNKDGEFSGGMAEATSSGGSAEASGNIFEAEGGSFANVYGGQAISLKKSKSTAAAEGNKLTLADAEVLKTVYGGYAESTADTGDADAVSGNASAKTNTLVLKGGRFSGNIYGGYASVTSSAAEASGNTVELRAGTDGKAPVFVDAKSVIWGGCALSGNAEGTSTKSTGNALKFSNVKGMKAANIRNFQALDFEHAELEANDVVMELTGNEDGRTTSIAGAEVTVSVKSLKGATSDIFQPGEKAILLKNANEKGLDTDGIKTTLVTPVVTAGVSISYEVEVRTNENELYLTRTESKPDDDDSDDGKKDGITVLPGTKAIAEGALAGLALVSESGEAVFEMLEDMAEQDLFTFGAVHAGNKTYETGSGISLSSVSMLAGIGKGFMTQAGHLSVGAFFEYGKGSYTTSNSFDDRADVDGDGNSWYMGGGILGKMRFRDTGPGHFYVEGSAHMGTLHNEYDSNDLTDSNGNVAKFDMDSPYYFLHGGLGYVWNFAEGHELEMYGKYLWTMVQGTDDTLTTSDKYDFDDMYSNRIRAGVRYSYTGSERFRPYIGAAYEHEFSGSCNARAYGYDVSSPSLEGGTGIGELGIAMMPTEALPLYLNLGVQGYVGTKQGVSGSCNFVYEF